MKKKVDEQYIDIAKKILKKGHTKETRQGGFTLSLFGEGMKITNGKHWNQFPYILQSKNVWMHGVVTELLWFLSGDTHIKYLVDNGVNIWNADAFRFNKAHRYNKTEQNGLVCPGPFDAPGKSLSLEEYVQMIKNNEPIPWIPENENPVSETGEGNFITPCDVMGDLGPVYGYQWIKEGRNQIAKVIELLKNDPYSRRAVVTAWNPEHIENMALPPCHFSFVLNARKSTGKELRAFEKYKERDETNNGFTLSLQFNMRSADLFLGVPFNLASYGLLLNLFAKELNMIPGDLVPNFGDVHIYGEHIDAMKTQIKGYKDLKNVSIVNIEIPPKFSFEDPKATKPKHFKLVNYNAPTIKAKLIA